MTSTSTPHFLKHYPEDYRSGWVQAVVAYPGYAWNAQPMWHLMGRTERFAERTTARHATGVMVGTTRIYYTYATFCNLSGYGSGAWEKVYLVWQLEIAALSGETGDRVCWECLRHLLQMQDFFITPVRAAGLITDGAVSMSWQFGRALI